MAEFIIKEAEEVRVFLRKYDGKWVSVNECAKECPAIYGRLALNDPNVALSEIPYEINLICRQAEIPGRIEEHGRGGYDLIPIFNGGS